MFQVLAQSFKVLAYTIPVLNSKIRHSKLVNVFSKSILLIYIFSFADEGCLQGSPTAGARAISLFSLALMLCQKGLECLLLMCILSVV
jgi:hypothetical protein